MEEIKAYKSLCCSKLYITKKACLEHEKRCMWNPANQAYHTEKGIRLKLKTGLEMKNADVAQLKTS